jgi:hypothetical protein
MNTINSFDVNQKINALPKSLLVQVDTFIDFLNFKKSDVNENFNNSQIESIIKGKNDIENDRLIPHKEAKERIKNYIKSKTL